jgi:type IX secretion system PorP/SprF family membrane protein
MKTRIILVYVLLLAALKLQAQDIHYSQFNSSPLNINPALTGLFDGDMRFVGNHRNQWSSITVPYMTTSVAFDLNVRPGRRSGGVLGAGMLVNRDKAGDSEFGSTQVLGSLSYTFPLGGYSRTFLTYGMQAGLNQRSINYGKLTFDSQYNGDQFDPGLGNGEDFAGSSFTHFDASAGANVFWEFGRQNNANVGAAVYHLNSPEQSLFGEAGIRLDRRLVIHSNSTVNLSSRIDLLPGILWMRQGRSNEITAGAYAKYRFAGRERQAVYFGSFFRLMDKDALILSARIDYSKFNIGLSYDINFSQLSVASHNRGGLELSVLYVLKKIRPSLRTKKIPCPIFL